MYHCHRYARQGWAGEPETDPTQCYEEREAIEGWELTPARCLENAHTAVLREKNVVAGKSPSMTRSFLQQRHNATIGSSTATVLNFNASSGLLRTLKCVRCTSRQSLSLWSSSLGDSGFIIVRSSNIIYESVYQTHYFNCPMYVCQTGWNPADIGITGNYRRFHPASKGHLRIGSQMDIHSR
jgi:protein phosphatase PTC7